MSYGWEANSNRCMFTQQIRRRAKRTLWSERCNMWVISFSLQLIIEWQSPRWWKCSALEINTFQWQILALQLTMLFQCFVDCFGRLLAFALSFSTPSFLDVIHSRRLNKNIDIHFSKWLEFDSGTRKGICSKTFPLLTLLILLCVRVSLNCVKKKTRALLTEFRVYPPSTESTYVCSLNSKWLNGEDESKDEM